MNFQKYKLDFATLRRGYILDPESLKANIKPLEITSDPSQSEPQYLDLLEYKKQVDQLKEQTSNEWIKLILKQVGQPDENESIPYLDRFKSTVAKYITQEMIVKFKMNFDIVMNKALQGIVDGKSEVDQEEDGNHYQQSWNEMYSDCYLMRVELGNSRRITEESYFSLLATLHCIMIQLSQLFDASLILLEPPPENKQSDFLIVGFALRSYQYLLSSQFYKRREARMISLQFTKLKALPFMQITFTNIDKILTNEILSFKSFMRCYRPSTSSSTSST